MNDIKTSPELTTALEELAAWERDIKQKRKMSTEKDAVDISTIPPPRPSIEILTDVKKPLPSSPSSKEKPKNKPAERIKSSDYRSWDKFDVDKALKEADGATEEIQTTSSITSIPSVESKAPTKASVKGKNTPRKDQALAEKEKGNTAFQKGQHAAAVTHYTTALSLDASDPVFWVNRAMAYIKLRKWAEAEKDCTQGLLLQPDNVKALWRRGIARKELKKEEEARRDLEEALKLDPDNKAVKEELAKLPVKTKSLEETKISQTDLNSVKSIQRSPRKRLVIEEVDEDDNMESVMPKIKPVVSPSSQLSDETRNLQTSISIDSMTSPMTSSTSSTNTNTSTKKFVPPKTTFEFERDWKTYNRDDSLLYQYLKCIPPASYVTLFKSSLESDYIAKIIHILHNFYMQNDSASDIYAVLDGLRRVKRFDMLIMFLDRNEQEGLHSIFTHLIGNETNKSIEKEKVIQLAKFYKVTI